MRSITFVSRKGGVGKSTSSLHVAAELHKRGKRVLLVDDDPNRPLISWARKGELELDVVSQAQLGSRLGSAPEYLIWDSEANPAPADLRDLATGASLLVVPCQADHLSLGALLALREDLNRIKGARPLAVMITMAQPNSHDAERFADALREGGYDVLGYVRRYAAYTRAQIRGTTVGDIEGGEQAASDYAAITDAILERL